MDIGVKVDIVIISISNLQLYCEMIIGKLTNVFDVAYLSMAILTVYN